MCTQALSNRQQKKPGKLFAPGSPRAGFSIFVRALSKDPVEARWLQRFINLATSDPSEQTSVIFMALAPDTLTPQPKHSSRLNKHCHVCIQCVLLQIGLAEQPLISTSKRA